MQPIMNQKLPLNAHDFFSDNKPSKRLYRAGQKPTNIGSDAADTVYCPYMTKVMTNCKSCQHVECNHPDNPLSKQFSSGKTRMDIDYCVPENCRYFPQ